MTLEELRSAGINQDLLTHAVNFGSLKAIDPGRQTVNHGDWMLGRLIVDPQAFAAWTQSVSYPIDALPAGVRTWAGI